MGFCDFVLFFKLCTMNQVCNIYSPVLLQKMISEIASGACKDSWPLNYRPARLEAVELVGSFSAVVCEICIVYCYD